MKRVLAAALVFATTSLFAGSHVVATKAALSTASPAATALGLSVLKRGGNAIDAAVAVAFALAVVHPQAGNLGGGGFLVYYDADSKVVWTLDFREVAPAAATRDMFEKADSRTGVAASGVPGSVAGLGAMHERFGSLPWKDLVMPSAQLAREGIRTDVELELELREEQEKRKIAQFPSTAALFFPEGKPLPNGSTLVQNDLAATLERIATGGAKEFYEGETATRFVEAYKAAGGNITFRDLRDYKPVWRAPLRIDFGRYSIYSVAPPSAGGLVLAQALNILAAYDLNAAGFQTPRAIHMQAEATRRAYIDRNKYVGDPATTRIPLRDLLSNQRASQWRKSIDMARSTPTVSLTEPATTIVEGNHTTHFTIVDAAGNVAAVTTTINENFGSGFVVPGCGFFLNNEMDDFTARPGTPNRYGMIQSTANAIEPGKRMVSSMTPAIVMKDDAPILALGTRGGPSIPTQVLQILLNVLVYKKPLVDAVAAPRYHQQATPDEIAYEMERAPAETITALNAMGHGVQRRMSIGDVHAISIEGGKIIAVADPRRGGAAGGF